MPDTDPLDDAFARYQQTDDYASAASFALDPEHVHHALRFVFAAAWGMAFGLQYQQSAARRGPFVPRRNDGTEILIDPFDRPRT